MGFFPMRDMTPSLPDAAHDLAAQAKLAGARVGHEPLGGRAHRDADAAADLGQLRGGPVDPKTGARNALQAVDRGLPVRGVAQGDAPRPLGAPASRTLKGRMNPPSCRPLDSSSLSLEAGTSQRSLPACTALRTRVRRSEMGSVIVIPHLPYQLALVTPGR